MRAEEIMKKNVHCLKPDDTCVNAARLMRDNNIGFVPICNDDRTVVGVITDRDICCRIVADNRAFDTKVSDCMSKDNIVWANPGDDISRVRDLMADQHVSRVLVADDQCHLCGVISLSDLAQYGDAADTMKRVSQREVAPA